MTPDPCLDTTGEVHVDDGPHRGQRFMWRNLSLFAQEYVEATIGSGLFRVPHFGVPQKHPYPAFTLLAPSTLSAMLKDCEAFRSPVTLRKYGGWTGKEYWAARQADRWGENAPAFLRPVTLFLGDDGLIYQRGETDR